MTKYVIPGNLTVLPEVWRIFSEKLPKYPTYKISARDLTRLEVSDFLMATAPWRYPWNVVEYDRVQIWDYLDVLDNASPRHYDDERMDLFCEGVEDLELSYLNVGNFLLEEDNPDYACWFRISGEFIRDGRYAVRRVYSKWPTVQSLVREVCDLARRFIFLKMTITFGDQGISSDGEMLETNKIPTILEFQIDRGKVLLKYPEEPYYIDHYPELTATFPPEVNLSRLEEVFECYQEGLDNNAPF